MLSFGLPCSSLLISSVETMEASLDLVCTGFDTENEKLMLILSLHTLSHGAVLISEAEIPLTA